MPERIHMTRDRPWRAEHRDAIIVARGAGRHYGNPFRIGTPTPVYWITNLGVTQSGEITAENRAEAAAYFRDWMNGVVEIPATTRPDPSVLTDLDLACWCPLDEPCHADVLLELANSQSLNAHHEGDPE